MADLGKQVTSLVMEVEAARGGRPSLSSPSRPLDTSSTEAVVEARLLNFRDVAELQERNIQLLAVVRELSANRLRAFQFSLMYVVFRIRIRIGSGRVSVLSRFF